MIFNNPIRSGKVRNGINWYQYKNGTIVIEKQKYIFYSIKEAIAKYRKQFPKYKKLCV